jgi:hypothetical protein
MGPPSDLTTAIETITTIYRDIQQTEREEQREREKEARQKLDELDKLGRNIEKQTTAIVSQYLRGSGYHYHRGEWRKRKMKGRVPALHHDDVFPLVAAANKATLPAAERDKLRCALEAHVVPHDDIGTLTNLAFDGLLSSLGNVLLEETTRAGVETLKASLGYDTSPMVERLLIEAICVAWIIHDKALMSYSDTIGKAGRSFKQELHVERRLTSAQRRYLRAIDSLGKIRKLKLPPVQINIGALGVQAINTTNQTTNNINDSMESQ